MTNLNINNVKPSDKYETPPEVYAEITRLFGQFDLDVCAEGPTKKCPNYFGLDKGIDALECDWDLLGTGTRCFMNPPYSNPCLWIQKAIEETRKGAVVFGLLPSDTSTAWYQNLVKNNPRCLHYFPPGRIRFLLNGKQCGSPKFGNIYALFW